MDQIRKEKIKQIMINVLKKNVNYPNCEIDAIVTQIKPMWLALEEAGLTEGLSFQAFQQHAHNGAIMAKIQGMFTI